jgi:hypothetical protein
VHATEGDRIVDGAHLNFVRARATDPHLSKMTAMFDTLTHLDLVQQVQCSAHRCPHARTHARTHGRARTPAHARAHTR